LKEAARRLEGEETRAVDVGRIDFTGREGQPVSRYFMNIASAGVSGLVDFEVNRTTKAFGGKVSFAVGTLKAMVRYRDPKVRLTLDDGPAQELDATVVAVANGQYFGGGMWVAPHAKPDDGLFDITLWSGYRLRDFAFKGQDIYSGKHVENPQTRCFQAKTVRVESEKQVLLDVDGEQPGQLPASMRLLPLALKLKVAADAPR